MDDGRRHTSYPPLAVWTISVSLDTVPYCSTDCLSQMLGLVPFSHTLVVSPTYSHAECTAEIR
jgi:hypothetical protein